MAGAVVVVAAVWLAFRRYASSLPRTAVPATATFLVSPYTLNYDLLLLMPAVVASFRHGADEGFLPGERLIHLLLWLMPLVLLLFGAVAWLRLIAPKGELRPVAAAR